MLLRASGEHDGTTLELDAVHGDVGSDGGVAHGQLIVQFAQACVSANVDEMRCVREELLAELGPDALIDSAATAAIFCAVVRVADATGIPLEPYKEELSADLRQQLDLDKFREGRDA